MQLEKLKPNPQTNREKWRLFWWDIRYQLRNEKAAESPESTRWQEVGTPEVPQALWWCKNSLSKSFTTKLPTSLSTQNQTKGLHQEVTYTPYKCSPCQIILQQNSSQVSWPGIKPRTDRLDTLQSAALPTELSREEWLFILNGARTHDLGFIRPTL